MQFRGAEKQDIQNDRSQHRLESITGIERQHLLYFSEKICRDANCRYPQLSLRILIRVVAGVDSEGRVYISARRLAQDMGVHYDTVTKCLKYLRQIEVLSR